MGLMGGGGGDALRGGEAVGTAGVATSVDVLSVRFGISVLGSGGLFSGDLCG